MSGYIPTPRGHALVYSEPGYTVSQDDQNNVYLNGMFVRPQRYRLWKLNGRLLVAEWKRAGVVFVRAR